MISTSYATTLLTRAAEPEMTAIKNAGTLLGSAMRSIDSASEATATVDDGHRLFGEAIRDVNEAKNILKDRAEVLDVARPLRQIGSIEWSKLERAMSASTTHPDPAVAQALDGVSAGIFDSIIEVAQMGTRFLDDIRDAAGRLTTS